MTIRQAFEKLISSEAFYDIAKKKDSEGGKYRVSRSRFNAGTLGVGGMVELLLKHGYKVSVRK